MSDAHETEPNDPDEQPALLQRIRPIARFVFGAIVISTIFALVAAGLNVAVEIWQRAAQAQ
jgi:hypothetical protein